jgi:hypothetical protein
MILDKKQMEAQKVSEATQNKQVADSNKYETSKRSFEIPPYWKKKIKPNQSKLWNALVSSAKSDPVATDDYGEYRKGFFLFSCAMVHVEICENGLWRLSIRSENPIGLPLIQAIRDKYIPDDFLMAMLFQDRAERLSKNLVQLFQLPNYDKNEEENKNDK